MQQTYSTSTFVLGGPVLTLTLEGAPEGGEEAAKFVENWLDLMKGNLLAVFKKQAQKSQSALDANESGAD